MKGPRRDKKKWLGLQWAGPDEKPKKRQEMAWALVVNSGWTLLEESPILFFVQVEPKSIRFMAWDLLIDLFNYHFCQ